MPEPTDITLHRKAADLEARVARLEAALAAQESEMQEQLATRDIELRETMEAARLAIVGVLEDRGVVDV